MFFSSSPTPPSLSETECVICPICNQICDNILNSIRCESCKCRVHHSNKKNCSGLTNREFKLHQQDVTKFWECDKCHSMSKSSLPFSHLDDDNWLILNELKRKQTSEDVNILSAKDIDFVTQCDLIQNYLNSENDDDILLNHVNSEYYDEKKFNSMKIDLPSSFGLFHANIASLNLHIDDLKLIL